MVNETHAVTLEYEQTPLDGEAMARGQLLAHGTLRATGNRMMGTPLWAPVPPVQLPGDTGL